MLALFLIFCWALPVPVFALGAATGQAADALVARCSWSAVAKKVVGRTGQQCAQRWRHKVRAEGLIQGYRMGWCPWRACLRGRRLRHVREGARTACDGVEREGRCKRCGLHAQQGGQRRSCGALALQVWRGECMSQEVGQQCSSDTLTLSYHKALRLYNPIPFHDLARWRAAAQVNPNIRKDKWTEVEDRALMRLVKTYGCAWAEISRLMDGRTDQQCMGRWRRHLDPAIRRDAWTALEDGTLQARRRGGRDTDAAMVYLDAVNQMSWF